MSDARPGCPIRAYDNSGNYRDFSTDELVGRKLNNFLGWSCGAGAENLQISMDGDVFAATCGVGGRLGNIFDEQDFSVPERWLTCPKEVCSCGADLFIPKTAAPEAATLLKKTFLKSSVQGMRKPDLEKIAALERNHASSLKQVYWEIGRRCNYDCSYCWPWTHNDFEPHRSLDELMKATKRIEEKFMKGAKVNFIISGGEPTINPAFMDWVKYLKSCGHHISCHSNGSRLPEYYRELIHYTDLNLSLHYEFTTAEKFLKVVENVTQEKARKLNRGVGHLEVKIMMAPGRRLQTLEVEKSLKAIRYFSSHCTWAIVPVREGAYGDEVRADYEADDYKLFGARA